MVNSPGALKLPVQITGTLPLVLLRSFSFTNLIYQAICCPLNAL